jgi:hypothetical protein
MAYAQDPAVQLLKQLKKEAPRRAVVQEKLWKTQV